MPRAFQWYRGNKITPTFADANSIDLATVAAGYTLIKIRFMLRMWDQVAWNPASLPLNPTAAAISFQPVGDSPFPPSLLPNEDYLWWEGIRGHPYPVAYPIAHVRNYGPYPLDIREYKGQRRADPTSGSTLWFSWDYDEPMGAGVQHAFWQADLWWEALFMTPLGP